MARNTPHRTPTRKQCDICHRDFARTEHLERHRRTHTSEKPFGCPFCQQAFPREDVRTRHIKKTHPSVLEHASLGDVIGTRSVRGKACEPCRSRKIKCAGGVPCEACQASHRTCSWSEAADNDPHDISQNAQRIELEHADSESFLWQPTSGSVAQSDQIIDHDITAGFPQPFSVPANGYPSQFQNDGDIARSNPLNWNIFDTGYSNWNGNLDYFAFAGSVPDVAGPAADFYTSIDWGVLLANEILDDPDQSATAMMKEYLDRRSSRRSSPSAQLRDQTWYSSPPQLQIYDDEVIDKLLKIFRNQLSGTFPVFANIQEPKTELCLAMAAIGALFCDVWGSFKVAKALYNDARKMLLRSKAYQSPDLCDELTMVKGFMLLEIYGLCCGEQRAFEFVEAFHQDLLQAYHKYCASTSFVATSSAKEAEWQLLLDSIYTLECYRVVILQRPPNLYLSSNIGKDAPLPGYEHSISESAKLVSALCTPGTRFDDHLVQSHSLPTLSILSLYTWPVIPRSGRAARSSSLWKVEFVDLALNNWMQSQDKSTDLSTTVLYHMININLHLNLGLLQRLVHAHILAKRAAPNNDELASLARSKRFEVALWHARSLLQCIQNQQARSRQANHTASRNFSSDVVNAHLNERPADRPYVLQGAPHIPYAIYFACLTEWTDGFKQEDSTALRATKIDLGIRLLSDLHVQVAEVLKKLLQELEN